MLVLVAVVVWRGVCGPGHLGLERPRVEADETGGAPVRTGGLQLQPGAT